MYAVVRPTFVLVSFQTPNVPIRKLVISIFPKYTTTYNAELSPWPSVKDNPVSITRSATRHHVLLLDFAVQSDTQSPTLILFEQVMLLPSTPDARINTPEKNLNFMKIYCNPNRIVNIVRQLLTFKANKS